MKTIEVSKKNRRWALGLAPLLIAGWLGVVGGPVLAHQWSVGDLFVAVSNGQYKQYTSTGATGDTLTVGAPEIVSENPETAFAAFTAGCAFQPVPFGANPPPPLLFTTLWSERKIGVVPNGGAGINSGHTPLTYIDTTAAGTVGHPETIAFNTDGDFFVGLVDAEGGPNLLKYSGVAPYNLLGKWTLPVGGRGVDAIDLAADQATIYYSSEDTNVYKYVIATTSTSGGTGSWSVFSTALTRAYGVRLLQGENNFGPSGSAGFMLVADGANIKVLNAAGASVRTYGAGVTPHQEYGNGWFSVSVSQGGESFVAGDFYTGRLVKFDAAGNTTPNILTGAEEFRVNGVCVRGELTTGVVPFPSSGFFVIGDTPAGYPSFATLPSVNNVNFWGNDWKTNNPMSGTNASQNAFKGFSEDTTPNVPTCGDTYQGGGGASEDPPAVLPPRVAVLVTTAATSTGSVKSQGIIKAIVLVDTINGTYNGGSGGSGFGKVVKVICKI